MELNWKMWRIGKFRRLRDPLSSHFHSTTYPLPLFSQPWATFRPPMSTKQCQALSSPQVRMDSINYPVCVFRGTGLLAGWTSANILPLSNHTLLGSPCPFETLVLIILESVMLLFHSTEIDTSRSYAAAITEPSTADDNWDPRGEVALNQYLFMSFSVFIPTLLQ